MDVGTTALKAIVLTPAGVAVAVAERAYRVGTVLGGGANLSGAVEQDPDDWLEAFGSRSATSATPRTPIPRTPSHPQPPSPSADRCRTSVSSATVEAFAPRCSTRTSAPPRRRARSRRVRPRRRRRETRQLQGTRRVPRQVVMAGDTRTGRVEGGGSCASRRALLLGVRADGRRRRFLRPDHREHDGSPLAARARRAAAVGGGCVAALPGD